MRDNGDGAPFSLKQNNCGIKHRAGGAHPRAEQRPVCGRLMLSMMAGMFSGLRLCQSADSKNTEYQCN